jgi:hypothetical protein
MAFKSKSFDQMLYVNIFNTSHLGQMSCIQEPPCEYVAETNVISTKVVLAKLQKVVGKMALK